MYNLFKEMEKLQKKPRGRPKKFKKKLTFHYPDISDYLSQHLDGFDSERKEMKELIMKVILLPKRHYYDDSAYSISTKFVRALGHKYESFLKINKKYNLYTVENQYEIGVYSRRMFPTDTLNAIIENMDDWEDQMKMKDSVKTIQETFPTNKIEVGDVTTINGVSIYSSLKIDYSKLDEYTESLDLGSNERMNALRWKSMCATANLSHGYIPQTYHSIECGRLVGTGLTLQSVPSEMRSVLLDGHYNYDFVNCHYSIIDNLGDYEVINHYVENTREVRELLSDMIGVTIDDIKKCLIALIYGARKGSNKFSSITKILGKERAEAFWSTYFIKNLKKDCDEAVMFVTGEKDYKGFARFLMNVESSILYAACEGFVIDVALYDGFICKQNWDVGMLQRKIYEKTRLNIKVKKEQLTSPV